MARKREGRWEICEDVVQAVIIYIVKSVFPLYRAIKFDGASQKQLRINYHDKFICQIDYVLLRCSHIRFNFYVEKFINKNIYGCRNNYGLNLKHS